MTKTTNEPVICGCGHSVAKHGLAGCTHATLVKKIGREESLTICPCKKAPESIFFARLSTLEAAVEEQTETIKKLRNGLFGMLASHGYVEGNQGEPENCDCGECATANSLLQATAPKVQS